MNQLATVVIIGRINVGKSALFNRLSETNKAIISRIPGTTRDYNQAEISWRRKTFRLIDTGGVDSDLVKDSIASLINKKIKPKPRSTDLIEQAIVQQTKHALEKADVILLVVDGLAGLLPADKSLALALKKLGRPVIIVCNKIDSQKVRGNVGEFFKLGFEKLVPLSAASGSGTGDLLDEIVALVKFRRGRKQNQTVPETIKVAVIGKPNVGKSSLVNQILGEPRVIVSPVAQTTREPQDTELNYRGHSISLIDTAGLRQRTKIKRGIEKQAAQKTLKTIQRAAIVLFVTEATTPLAKQDSHLAGLLKDAGTGIIIIGNKWDLLNEKSTTSDKEMTRRYRGLLPHLDFAPLLFVSAKTGRNVGKLLDTVITVWNQRALVIDQDQLDQIKNKIVAGHRPSQAKGPLRPKIYNLRQTGTNPPKFTITIGPRQSLHFSYIRFIENQLRAQFDFIGVPIKIQVETNRH